VAAAVVTGGSTKNIAPVSRKQLKSSREQLGKETVGSRGHRDNEGLKKIEKTREAEGPMTKYFGSTLLEEFQRAANHDESKLPIARAQKLLITLILVRSQRFQYPKLGVITLDIANCSQCWLLLQSMDCWLLRVGLH
jgi:hypothetical protein